MSYRTAFLAWPPAVRWIVYGHLGLPDGNTIVIPVQSGHTKGHHQLSDIARLVIVCKTLNIELSHLLYAGNVLHLRVETSADLRFLQNLRPQTIAQLRGIVICLNTASCPMCTPSTSCRQNCSSEGSQRLPNEDALSALRIQSIASDWQHTTSRLFAHIAPYSLDFTLDCDIADHELASLILGPLQAKNLALAACSINLAQSCDTNLIEYVNATARNALQAKTNPRAFRFLDLPAEIRLSILRYTDLVTPLKEVYWNENGGYSVFYPTMCETSNGCMQDEHFHYACQFRLCSQGYICRSGTAPDWTTVPEALGDMRLPGCFNRYELKADVPDGWRCRCWAPPKAHFQVCRRMHQDAETIFFQENRFVLYLADGFCGPPTFNPARFSPSIFLEWLRPSAAKSLRMLEVVFPPFKPDYCLPDSEVYSDWKKAIKRAKRKLQVANFSLRIYMTDHLEVYAEQERLPDWRLHMSAEDGNELVATYRRILTPLAELSGLERLFLHLSWPWQWVVREHMGWEDGKEYSERESQKLADDIGQSILGKDEYTRVAAHEDMYIDSQWLQWTRIDFYV